MGIPYGYYQMGLYLCLAVNILVVIQTCNTGWLYLNAKDLIKGKPESMFEIGFMLYKRKSIFFIAWILVANSLGLCMVYFIIFAKIMVSLLLDSNLDTSSKFASYLVV